MVKKPYKPRHGAIPSERTQSQSLIHRADVELSQMEALDSANTPKKSPVGKIQFDHDSLRLRMKKARKESKLNIKYAAEACGIAPDRFARLERGYAETRDRIAKFTVHEIMSVCLTFDMDFWSFAIMPHVPQGSPAEQRDRAWGEAQLAWQQSAELRSLLRRAVMGMLSVEDKKRVLLYCGPMRTWRLSGSQGAEMGAGAESKADTGKNGPH